MLHSHFIFICAAEEPEHDAAFISAAVGVAEESNSIKTMNGLTDPDPVLSKKNQTSNVFFNQNENNDNNKTMQIIPHVPCR